MSDQINADKMKATKRIEPMFWEDKRFIAVSEVLKENPRRDNVAGWHSLQLIRQGGEVGIGYRDWKDNMPTNIPNALGTNHKHLKWDLDHGHIRVVLDTITAQVENRIRGKGAPPPQKARAASVMRNVGSTTYVFKIYSDTKLKAFKLGRSEDPKTRQDLFNLHSMPSLGGLFYKRFLEYTWINNEDAHRLESWLKISLEAYRRQDNPEIINGVTQEQLELVWKQGIKVISASEETYNLSQSIMPR